jgi:endoglucanase
MKRLLTAGTALMIFLPIGAAASAAPSRAAASAIRVDQVGYAQSEAKRAYLLSAKPAPGATFTVRDGHGHAALTGKVGPNAGAWNATYTAVHPIDFGKLRTAGTYTIKVGDAVSPPFRIAPADKLFNPLVRDAVSFFTVQRDGADVDRSLLDRKPSHLTDRKATVYDPPVFTGDGGDVPAAPLKATGGPVDVEGGWFDAGDFVKFTHTTAYALSELLWVQRGGGPVRPDETYRGLTWLDKMWDAQHQTLYAQVGIGTGSEDFNFLGDHDVWRLPEADDALKSKPGDDDFYIKYRPVFTAAPPEQKISPNLAGRVSAAFALGAQVALKLGDTGTARRWFGQATSVYAQAKTTDVGELVTAYPHAYYPEDSWADDMEFGAAELARTGRLLGDPRAAGWLRDAAQFAKTYLTSDSQETLNLYDTSALGHTELINGIRATHASGLAVSEGQLIGDLKRQLDFGVDSTAEQPFGHAVDVTNFDAATRSFGFAATAQLYRSVTGKDTYNAFGTRQRDFALGANAWGASLMIGEGTNYPLCPQHQVANLAGSLTGGNRVIKGAVVNGPNGADNFEDLGIPDGANACPADGSNRFAAYDTADSRFLDDVQAWPSVEPALDFTATAALALSLTARD